MRYVTENEWFAYDVIRRKYEKEPGYMCEVLDWIESKRKSQGRNQSEKSYGEKLSRRFGILNKSRNCSKSKSSTSKFGSTRKNKLRPFDASQLTNAQTSHAQTRILLSSLRGCGPANELRRFPKALWLEPQSALYNNSHRRSTRDKCKAQTRGIPRQTQAKNQGDASPTESRCSAIGEKTPPLRADKNVVVGDASFYIFSSKQSNRFKRQAKDWRRIKIPVPMAFRTNQASDPVRCQRPDSQRDSHGTWQVAMVLFDDISVVCFYDVVMSLQCSS